MGSTSAEPSLSNEVSDRRSLLVVDTNSGDLQSLSSDLPDKTDLIVLDRSIDGIQQLKNSVDDAADLGIHYQSVAVVVSRDATNNIAFGNSQHGEAELSADLVQLGASDWAQDAGLRLKLFVSQEPSSQAIAPVETEILADASVVENHARELLNQANLSGLLKQAVKSSFDQSVQDGVLERTQQFLDGVNKPIFKWADFNDGSIQGAFISSKNTILLSNTLRENDQLFDVVLLEELGHWLEDSFNYDSTGDEGEIFSKYLSGDQSPLDQNSDHAELSIGGVIFKAELATITDPGAISVDENTTTVATLDYTQATGSVTWSLDDSAADDHQLFSIDSSSGALTFRAAPDYENAEDVAGTASDNIYSVTVKATESGAPDIVTTQVVSVTVSDVDDTAPLITDGTTSVAENTIGSFYTFTSNETVTWSISGGDDQSLFDIDSATGELSFKQANIPDYESAGDNGGNNVYNVTIRATDASSNFAEQEFTVSVTDVDEDLPEFAAHNGAAAGAATASISIAENKTSVHQFATNDSNVTWSILDGDDKAKFAINSSTGELSFIEAPDFETPQGTPATTGGADDNTYVVKIGATDPAGNVASQTVTITVGNVDEDSPLFLGGSHSVKENAASEFVIHTFEANEDITQWNLSGTDSAKFTLSPVAGNDKQAELKVKAYTTTSTLPAFSSTASENIFNIVVSATDGSGNTSDQSIAINLLEADAPQITGPNSSTGTNSTISISESTTQVHKFVADEPVSWSINGDDAGKFSIDAAGNLSLAAALDYENPTDTGDTAANNTYAVNVVATDSVGNATTQALIVTITDADENLPEFAAHNGAASWCSNSINFYR